MEGNLVLMCGIPGSGKSTFLQQNVKNRPNTVIISRDEIRFSIVKPNEEYFSHEDEVVKIFWKQINDALAAGKSVYVDQTSITPKSRAWLLQHVHGYKRASVLWIDECLKTCLERNKMRKGTRAYVPEDVIRRMSTQFAVPSIDEGFDVIIQYNSKDDKIRYIKKEV